MVINFNKSLVRTSQSQSNKMRQSSQLGFSLIEIMIVVAIIGILAAIAYPSYQRYVIKTNRADMMSELQQIASRIESQKLNYRRYDRIPVTAVLSGTPNSSGRVDFPSSGTALYTVYITPMNGANTLIGSSNWTILAEPKSGSQMTDDGTLTLNHQNIKCRNLSQTDKRCGQDTEWSK